MANALFTFAKEGFLGGDIVWDTDNIKVLIGRDYTLDLADQYRSDLTGITVIATSGNLTGKTIVGGVADANDINYVSVAAGPDITCLIIYKDNGSAATDRLIAYIDSGVYFPFSPTGSDVPLVWSVSGIFQL